MKVERIFSHRTHGRIGHVELEQKGDKWLLDGKELPEASIRYLMTFSLQSLQDAYAGADNTDEAQGAWAKKRDAIIAGTVGIRTGNGGEEPHMPFVRKLIRERLGEENKKAYSAISSDDQQARKAFLNDLFDGLDDEKREKVETAAKQLHEADMAAKKAAKDASAGLEI